MMSLLTAERLLTAKRAAAPHTMQRLIGVAVNSQIRSWEGATQFFNQIDE